jgi:hypothetical protein
MSNMKIEAPIAYGTIATTLTSRIRNPNAQQRARFQMPINGHSLSKGEHLQSRGARLSHVYYP